MRANGTPSEVTIQHLRLVQLCDSALPIGGFSHSWGLEAAIARRQVTGPREVEDWVRAWLTHTVVPSDGMLATHAAGCALARAWDALVPLNHLLTASKASPTLRRASLQQGDALLGLAASWPWSGETAAYVRACDRGPWHHAVVFGALAATAGAAPVDALALYIQNAAGAVVAAAVRAVPIGHTHGQQVLARIHDLIAAQAAQWAEAPLACFGSLSPAYEVLAYAQSQLYTRIFQS